ncbi:MAG: hypothetical protein WCO82_09595 [Sphingomonadales bacterium]|jgi:hypothetical protein
MNSDFGPLLVRWLCHDMATPIASVMTASDLLSEEPDVEINELVQHGTRRLAGRLRLLRLALGGSEGGADGAALASIVRDGLDGVPVDWQRMAAGQAVVVAGAALLLADLNRNRPLLVADTSVTYDRDVTLPPAVEAALAGAAPVCTRSAVAAMLGVHAGRAGVSLAVLGNGIGWA